MEFNATFLVSAISFIVFVFLMNKIFYAPLEKIIIKREQLVDDTLNEAKISRDNALSLLQEREDKLIKASNDSKSIVNNMVSVANENARTKTAEAKNSSIEQLKIHKQELDQQAVTAKNELCGTVQEIANQIVEKILG